MIYHTPTLKQPLALSGFASLFPFFQNLLLIILTLLVCVGQVSAGPNANAMVTIDLITDGGAGNQTDDGVTTGTVSGQGTKIAVEVFATGVTTSLVGVQIEFDFDASVLTFDKAEWSYPV